MIGFFYVAIAMLLWLQDIGILATAWVLSVIKYVCDALCVSIAVEEFLPFGFTKPRQNNSRTVSTIRVSCHFVVRKDTQIVYAATDQIDSGKRVIIGLDDTRAM